MPHIEYSHVGKDRLHLISDLRERLRVHHQALSGHFPEDFSREALRGYMARFMEGAGDAGLRIFMASDTDSGDYVGYCLATVDEKSGEICSVFVDEAYRGRGVGDGLVSRAIHWLDENGADPVQIHVLPGNDAAQGFYARYGFRPCTLVMKRV